MIDRVQVGGRAAYQYCVAQDANNVRCYVDIRVSSGSVAFVTRNLCNLMRQKNRVPRRVVSPALWPGICLSHESRSGRRPIISGIHCVATPFGDTTQRPAGVAGIGIIRCSTGPFGDHQLQRVRVDVHAEVLRSAMFRRERFSATVVRSLSAGYDQVRSPANLFRAPPRWTVCADGMESGWAARVNEVAVCARQISTPGQPTNFTQRPRVRHRDVHRSVDTEFHRSNLLPAGWPRRVFEYAETSDRFGPLEYSPPMAGNGWVVVVCVAVHRHWGGSRREFRDHQGFLDR